MVFIDLDPVTAGLSTTLRAVPIRTCRRPTPCAAYTVGDLLDHIQGLTIAFGAAASRTGGEAATIGPSGDASNLDPDWRASIPRRLGQLATAWRDPAVWTGETAVGWHWTTSAPTPQRNVLLRQASMILEGAERDLDTANDLVDVGRRNDALVHTAGRRPATVTSLRVAISRRRASPPRTLARRRSRPTSP